MASLQQSSSIVFFLLTITFFFLASPVFCKPKNETLIEQICRDKQVEDYEFCQRTFHTHITCPLADIHSLTKFTIRHTFALANFAYTNILHLLELKTDRSTKKDLQKCKEGYDVVISEFELVNTILFEKHEYKDAFDAASETLLAIKDCKADIKIPQHPKSPIIETNKHTRTLIAMSLASLKLLMRIN